MNGLRPIRKLTSKSATRALEVLELFGEERGSLRAKQIGNALGLRPSSTDLLLKTMAHSGYIIFDPLSKEYEPSPKLFKFSSFLKDNLYRKNEDVPRILAELWARTGAIATLALRNGDFMCITDTHTDEGDDYRFSMGQGYALDGISGTTLLSALEEEETLRILDRAARYRHLSGDWRSTLLPAIREAAARGFSFGATCSPAFWAAAVPVALGFSGRQRFAVLSASGTKDYIRPRSDAIVEATHALARELSAA